MRDRWRLLYRTSRPLVWTWFAAPFLLAFVISGAELAKPLVWLQIVGLGPLYCLIVYGINDVYDYESDIKNQRKGEGKSQGGALEPKDHGFILKSSGLAAAVLMAIALATKNPANIAGMSFLLIWAYTYSAPPVRLKERPSLDSISNGFGYVLVPALMGFSFGAPLAQFPASGYWAAFVIASMHAFFAVLDYHPDKQTGVNTIAVKFGPKKTALLPVTATLLTILISPMKGLIPRILLLELLTLSTLVALDVYNVIEFKKRYRDKALGAVYLTGLVLTTLFILQNRGFI